MRLLTHAVLALALLLALPALADHHGDLQKEVEAIGDALGKAMVAGDFEAMAAHYADDAISLPNYEPRIQGLDSMRDNFKAAKQGGMDIKSFESTATEVWQAGDNVIEIGTFEIKLDMGGTAIEDAGKYVTIYERGEDGKLKIVVETWNSDIKPMAMMGAPE